MLKNLQESREAVKALDYEPQFVDPLRSLAEIRADRENNKADKAPEMSIDERKAEMLKAMQLERERERENENTRELCK